MYDFKSKIATVKHNIEDKKQDYELIRDITSSSFPYTCVQKELRVDNFTFDMIWRLEGDYLAVHFKSENLTLSFEQIRELIYTPLYVTLYSESERYGQEIDYQSYVSLNELQGLIEEYELKNINSSKWYKHVDSRTYTLVLNRPLTKEEKKEI